MKESYREDIASSSGLNAYADGGNDVGVASVRGGAGQPLSSVPSRRRQRPIINPVCRSCHDMEKAISSVPYYGEVPKNPAESKTLSMCRNSRRENREILLVSTAKEGGSPSQPSGQKTLSTVLLTGTPIGSQMSSYYQRHRRTKVQLKHLRS